MLDWPTNGMLESLDSVDGEFLTITIIYRVMKKRFNRWRKIEISLNIKYYFDGTIINIVEQVFNISSD